LDWLDQFFRMVFFPYLHGNYNLPYNVPANEYLRFEGEKFSKSRGIGFTVDEMLKFVDKNSLRYYMASILPETGDSDFSLHEFQYKVNSELVDKYGNYIYRMESFIEKNNLSPAVPESFDKNDIEILDLLRDKFAAYCEEIGNLHIKHGLSIWLELVMVANNYFTEAAPWKLIKEDMKKLNEKLYISLKIGQYLTAMLYPYVPSASISIMESLGIELIPGESTFSKLLEDDNFHVNKGKIPFEKIDLTNPNILDIQLATVISVENHPSADSLYIVKLKGDKVYTSVSDLKKYYSTDALEGTYGYNMAVRYWPIFRDM